MSNKILSKILEVAEENRNILYYLNDGIMTLFSKIIDEQDGDYENYGIAKYKREKFSFCYSDGKRGDGVYRDRINYISIKEMEEKIEEWRPYGPDAENIKKHFLEEIEEPLREFLLSRAAIEKKLKEGLKD